MGLSNGYPLCHCCHLGYCIPFAACLFKISTSTSTSTFRSPVPSKMVRRHISTELKEKALSMSLDGMPDAEIRELTGISERSLKRLRSVYRKTGGVVPPPPIDLGRPRVLTAIHVKVRGRNVSILDSTVSHSSQFLCDCVDRHPNAPLSELRTELREVCNVDVSVQTIARSLQRVGYTKKKAVGCH